MAEEFELEDSVVMGAVFWGGQLKRYPSPAREIRLQGSMGASVSMGRAMRLPSRRL